MKAYYLALFFLPFGMSFAQEPDAIDHVADLVRRNGVEELSRDFAPSVELTISGRDEVLSKTAAKESLALFFRENPAKTVRVFHRVTSSPKFRFAVLLVRSDNGIYRISFSLRSTGDQFELTEMRIEPEREK